MRLKGVPCPDECVVCECIKVEKVYDFCFQEETFFLCFDVPGLGGPNRPIFNCEVIIDACAFVSCRPVPSTNLARVRFRKTFRIRFNADSPIGPIFTSAPRTIEKLVTLCAPADPRNPNRCDPRMKFQCDTLGFCEDCENPAPNEVCCNVSLCQDFQSHATVKLKVPTYGLCVAKPCPPFACPDFPVPPEQCNNIDP